MVLVAACFHGDVELPPPTCAAAAEHVRVLLRPASARANRIRDVLAARCSADAWSGEVRVCVVATRTLRDPQHCKAKLTAEQRGALDRELAALPAAAHVAWAPPPCNDYRALLDKISMCTALPPELRAAFERGYREIIQDWSRGIREVSAVEALCQMKASDVRRAVSKTCRW